MPQRLPRFNAAMNAIEDERKVAKLVLEAEEADEAPRLVNGADGHNWERRRGLPLVSKGVGGAMRGTNPLGALIAKENGRRRR